MEERLRSGSMTFDDFMMQMDVMQKGASVQAMIGKLGGGGAQAEEMEAGRKKLLSYKQYVEVMDAEAAEAADADVAALVECGEGAAEDPLHVAVGKGRCETAHL